MTALLELAKLLVEAEEGNAASCLALATAWWQGGLGLERNDTLANIYLNRFYLSKCKRLHRIGEECSAPAALYQLVEAHSQNQRVGDCVIPYAFCSLCENAPEPALCIFTGESRCGTAEDLIGYGIRCAENVCANYLPSCTQCGAATSVACADFFTPAFHPTDYLVVRLLFDEQSMECADYGALWWNQEDGFCCIEGDIPDESERCMLVLERAARLAAGNLTAAAIELIRYAATNYADDPDLIHACLLLADSSESELAEQIARAHIKQFPADPVGHCYLAEILLRWKTFEAGAPNSSVVEAAIHRTKEALRIRAHWKEPLLLQCILMSLTSKPIDVVVNAYRKLLRQFPDYGPAHYDFALYCQQVMPELSTQHLQIAQSLMPQFFVCSEIHPNESVSETALSSQDPVSHTARDAC